MSTGSSTIFASFLFDRIKTYITNDPGELQNQKNSKMNRPELQTKKVCAKI